MFLDTPNFTEYIEEMNGQTQRSGNIMKYRLILIFLVTFTVFTKNLTFVAEFCHGIKSYLPIMLDLLKGNDVVCINEA